MHYRIRLSSTNLYDVFADKYVVPGNGKCNYIESLKPREHFKRQSRKRPRFFINGKRYVPVVGGSRLRNGAGVLLRKQSVTLQMYMFYQHFARRYWRALFSGRHYLERVAGAMRVATSEHLDDSRIRGSGIVQSAS